MTTAKKPATTAFMKPMTPSAELAAIVGKTPLPRTEVTKKLWDYIKANKLQDENNRRLINADTKLQAVFAGQSQVSMFEMTKLVNAHLHA
jgi:chromatin remodeling complex protein RSC6